MGVTTLNLDPDTSFKEQLNAKNTGPVVLINNFHIPSGKLEEAFAIWEGTAEILKKQPGYISAQLHRGVGGANIMVNYAIWESAETLKAGLEVPEFLATLEKFPEGTTMRPAVLHKLAIPNVCVPY